MSDGDWESLETSKSGSAISKEYPWTKEEEDDYMVGLEDKAAPTKKRKAPASLAGGQSTKMARAPTARGLFMLEFREEHGTSKESTQRGGVAWKALSKSCKEAYGEKAAIAQPPARKSSAAKIPRASKAAPHPPPPPPPPDEPAEVRRGPRATPQPRAWRLSRHLRPSLFASLLAPFHGLLTHAPTQMPWYLGFVPTLKTQYYTYRVEVEDLPSSELVTILQGSKQFYRFGGDVASNRAGLQNAACALEVLVRLLSQPRTFAITSLRASPQTHSPI